MTLRRNSLTLVFSSIFSIVFIAGTAGAQVKSAPPEPAPKPVAPAAPGPAVAAAPSTTAPPAKAKEDAATSAAAKRDDAAKKDASKKEEAARREAAKKETADRIKAANEELAAKIDAAKKESAAKADAAKREAAAKIDAAKKGLPVVVTGERAPDAPPSTEVGGGAKPSAEATKLPTVPSPATVPEQEGTRAVHIPISSADLAKVCADPLFTKDGACDSLRTERKSSAARGRALRQRDTLCNAENTATAGRQNADLASAHDRACGKPIGFSKVYADLVSKAKALQVTSGATPCAVWEAAKAVVPEGQRADLSPTLESGCGQSSKVMSLLPVELLATTVLQGTGDFLKTRAKEELIAYAVDQLGSQACKKDGKVRTFLTFPNEPFVFDGTCTSAFGSSGEGALDYQAFTDGRFQKAFEKELPDAPVALLRAVDRSARKHDGSARIDATEAKVWIDIAGGLFSGMRDIGKTGSAPLDVLKTLDASVTERMTKDHFSPGSEAFSCSIGKDKDGKAKPISAPCDTLFALRAGSSVQYQNGTVAIAGTLDAAKASFCKDYALGEAAKSGACVTDDQLDRAAVWLDEAIAVLNDLIDVEAARKKLVAGGATPLEVAKKTAPDYAKDVERLLRATVDVAKSSNAPASTLDWLTAMSDASAAVGAIVGQDYPAAAADLKAVLALDTIHEAVKDELGTSALRGLNFLLSLGAAKDADGVKQVLEEQAEPLGSYRQKYTDDFVLSLNGFVGPGIGVAHHFSVNNGAATNVAELKPLSALVGLDFSFRVDRQHLGFTLTAVDALGAGTVDKKEGGRIDWGGVLVPGVTLRWGIQKSPIVFFASGQWQPLRKSESATAGVDDWKGAMALYGGFAVDIPILTLCQD